MAFFYFLLTICPQTEQLKLKIQNLHPWKRQWRLGWFLTLIAEFSFERMTKTTLYEMCAKEKDINNEDAVYELYICCIMRGAVCVHSFSIIRCNIMVKWTNETQTSLVTNYLSIHTDFFKKFMLLFFIDFMMRYKFWHVRVIFEAYGFAQRNIIWMIEYKLIYVPYIIENFSKFKYLMIAG